jgi:signal transduction histidine kinase
LAAGVTHEILNPVTIISLELQMLMRESDLSPKTRQRLTVCMEQINRIVNIAEGLKGFSRVKENRLAMGDIAEIVDYILMLYQPQLKMKNVQTNVQYAANLPMTLVDRERIEQVILNLIENAVASMEATEEKALRISVDRRTAAGKKDMLRVTVADTGAGIRKQDMTKLFEPFFTTKAPGKGTGLGLSISFGIIQDHGGRIWAENNEWGGASFFFEIPIIADEGGTVIKA